MFKGYKGIIRDRSQVYCGSFLGSVFESVLKGCRHFKGWLLGRFGGLSGFWGVSRKFETHWRFSRHMAIILYYEGYHGQLFKVLTGTFGY